MVLGSKSDKATSMHYIVHIGQKSWTYIHTDGAVHAWKSLFFYCYDILYWVDITFIFFIVYFYLLPKPVF